MQTKVLTEEQRAHFMEKGYVRVSDCFGQKEADWLLDNVWERLGMDPNDQSTWTKERINMPPHRTVHVKDLSPKAWAVILELIGGEDRINIERSHWHDAIIANLGSEEFRGDKWEPPKKLGNWHCDGDFYRHYLDSPEEVLNVFPVLSEEIKPHAGGTMIAPESVSMVAKQLADHPEGIITKGAAGFECAEKIQQCTEFVELTGKLGEVIFVHPFMIHSASRNSLRIPRFITAPKIWLKEPLKYNRPTEELSLVERTTLRALGKESYDFQIKGQRETWRTQREVNWDRVRVEEMGRIKASHESSPISV